MKFQLLSFFVLLCLLSCSDREFVPRDGDLLFVVAETSAMSDAIVDATQNSGSGYQFDHVAFVLYEDQVPMVVEASPRYGVRKTEYSRFIDGSRVVVKRLTVPFQLDDVREKLSEHLGEEYDWYYLPDNGRMYCSELIYDIFRNRDGSPIFSARPMNFRDEHGEMPVFWIELFEKLGISVPEGVPGTNPNDMSKESFLEEIAVL